MAKAGVAIAPARSRDRWWRGLAARATLAFGVLFAALALLLIANHAADMRRGEERSLVKRAVEQAERVAERVRAERLGVAELGDLIADPSLAYAYVETDAGAVVAGAAPAAPAPSPSREGLARTLDRAFVVTTSSGGLAHAAKRLSVDGETMTLRLGLSLGPAEAAGAGAATRGLLAALAFLAIALPALALTVDRAASPLRLLAQAAQSPGGAEAAMRLAGRRRDEVGALARAHAETARTLAENAAALRRLTFDDPLTRLPNRESLMSRLVQALQLSRPAALLIVEVEGLRRIAAGLGQHAGDEAVQRAAERLFDVARAFSRLAGPLDDGAIVLARVSDTGFALLAPGADEAAARTLAKSALAAFETPLVVDDLHVATTLAVGVALAPQDGEDAGALMRSASAAAAAARAAGPQAVRFAGVELSRMAHGRLRLEQDLRRAIETGAIELHYQPQVRLDDGAASGAEALARWRHPIRGMIPPMEFVAIAEECGLIGPLGRLVLAQASAKAADWRGRGLATRIAVNVSAIEFRRPGFGAEALKIIAEAGADASEIELEITESAAMGDPEHAARELAPLKEAGIRIAIDDFGAGYSNLAALTRLPFDVLKIDRAFVRDAASEPGAMAVVHAVVGLARNLGFETVAEGVETDEQRDLVARLGATHAQGYLFGKPMPAEAFEAWRAERRVAELRALGRRATPGEAGLPLLEKRVAAHLSPAGRAREAKPSG